MITAHGLAPHITDRQLPVPPDRPWDRLPDGRPMPNVVRTVRLSRQDN
jgi:hypothetical protein